LSQSSLFRSGLLERRDGIVYFDKVSLVELASKFGTPLYVLSESRIRDNYRRLHKAFHDCYRNTRIYYAAKANTNMSVLAIMHEEGAFLDVLSPGEIYLALKSGFDPERILYTGTSVSEDEVDYALKSNIIINVDSLPQMGYLLRKAHPRVVCVRVNPEVGAGHHEHCVTGSRDSKFGLLKKDTYQAYRMAKEAGVDRFGIQMHIGSGILNPEPYFEAMENLLAIARDVRRDLEIIFDFIDLGGGFGVPYRPKEQELDLEETVGRIVTLFEKRVSEYRLGEPALCIEPGRYIVCDAGILLTRVNSVKTTPFKEFASVDAGFNTLIRPSMYGSYHEITLANATRAGTERAYDVVGPLCESGDFLARDRRLEEIRSGDVLAVLNAGAYGFVMSSQYNSRPRPAEVLLKDGRYAVVREKEQLETLTTGQEMAEWLQ
jgi:diaminopimelate decarboxylase